jgi:hypothetical protein
VTDCQAAVAIRAFLLGLKVIRVNAREQGLGPAESLSFSLKFRYKDSSGQSVDVVSEPYSSFQSGGAYHFGPALEILRELVRLCPDMELSDWENACREAMVGGVMRQ